MIRRPTREFIAGVMIFGASICTVIALASLAYCWHFVRTATRGTGRITQLVESKDKDGDTLYTPVFVFRDAAGIEHTVYSSIASYPPSHQVGDSVFVLYSPQSPQDAKIDSFFSLWGLPAITGGLAGFYMPLGLLLRFWPRIVQKFRREPPVINPV